MADDTYAFEKTKNPLTDGGLSKLIEQLGGEKEAVVHERESLGRQVTGLQEKLRVYEILAALYETQLLEKGVSSKEIDRLRKQQTGVDALERGLVAELKKYIAMYPAQPIGYIFLLDHFFHREKMLSDGDTKYVSYLFFKARKTGGTSMLHALAYGYVAGKEYACAERAATLLSTDKDSEAMSYRLRATVIRQQNTTNNSGVEKRAAYLDYQASQIEKAKRK